MSNFVGTPTRSNKSESQKAVIQSPVSVTGLFTGSDSPIDSPRRHSTPRKSSRNAVGSQWSVELSCLQNSGSSFEVVQCLRRMEDLLTEVDLADRIRFCKSDFILSVASLQQNPKLWHNDIVKEVIHICRTYFDHNAFSKLPECVMMAIMLWLPVREFSSVVAVCHEWRLLTSSCCIWKEFYHYKFLRNNTVYQANPENFERPDESYRTSFRNRLLDPNIGDKVEVAWTGKFRLEGADVYQGMAWWVAEVVDKHSSEKKYKIRYPGWDRRWDEWVPKRKLRWAVENNTVASLRVNDYVEIWCCGASVPGAWLESRITRIRNGRYCVGDVLSTGPLWVDRVRLRPATRKRSSRSASPNVAAAAAASGPNYPIDESAAGGSGSVRVLPMNPTSIDFPNGDNNNNTQQVPRARSLWAQVRRAVRSRGRLRRSLSISFRAPSFFGGSGLGSASPGSGSPGRTIHINRSHSSSSSLPDPSRFDTLGDDLGNEEEEENMDEAGMAPAAADDGDSGGAHHHHQDDFGGGADFASGIEADYMPDVMAYAAGHHVHRSPSRGGSFQHNGSSRRGSSCTVM